MSTASQFTDELARMGAAMARYSEEYRAFTEAAQAYRWQEAGAHQERASAYLEATMDAFMRACRISDAEARRHA